MILPVAFIPTSRRALLAILLILGTLILAIGTLSRALIITDPANLTTTYLHYITTESSLSIIFANLPFLTSLVVTVAPARIRQLSLSQWPRSRRGSGQIDMSQHCLRMSRVSSTTSVFNTRDMKEAGWTVATREVARHTGSSSQSSCGSGDALYPAPRTLPIVWHEQVFVDRPSNSPTSPPSSPRVLYTEINDGISPAVTTEEWESVVPRTRSLDTLPEFGARSQDRTRGWPIYWQ